ncbi:MAG: RNA-binding transcriptional accessory protein [Chitinispirillia bacterium]|nr:RNA-binding transcriptional accessory protein [Chitinispirillia bacterium]MCL2242225.1 RNA-binding transcriptional accessory protein [Chitinispirillia bacterium]
MDICGQLVKELNLKEFQVKNTLELFDEGATVPFIARYRKERTGELDEIQIRDMQHRYTYYKELEERRAVILESIEQQGKLTPGLRARVNATLSKTELEDLYLPYKPKRTTRATKAKDAGLEPLADWLVGLEDGKCDVLAKAGEFINPEKEVDTPEKAVAGARDILAERLSDDADNRKWMRELAADQGFIVSAVKKEFEGQKSKFEMYYNYKEKASAIPSHRVLAMLRGEREKTLRLSLEMPVDSAVAYLDSRLIKYPQSAAAGFLHEASADSFDRLLQPATETEIRKELRDKADEEAIKVFGNNLEALLLAAPAGRKSVIGVDPGFRTGCKVVVVDDTGKFIENATIYPHEPQKDADKSRAVLLALMQRHKAGLVAVGNGTAGRETDEFVRAAIKDVPEEQRPVCVVVSEAGASVYSASDVAIKEFPDLDLTVRGAISIARRLQDPLSELVKIDPKSIGVGQYQHDVNQTRLKESLDEVVESSVNKVGVDINLASEELLKYVSGLNRLIAANIVNYRNRHGAFSDRQSILKVPGLGDKKFQLAAGFLRIPGSGNPLDNSAVHPESYNIVKKMAGQLKATVNELIGNTALLHSINKKDFVTGEVGLPTITDIISELEKPGRDPRAEFRYARFNEEVTEIAHLKEGMLLEGTVTNVTNFGAFVDIGVHQDGLVHISELSNTYVSDPKTVVKAGQVVKVRVVKIDAELKRVALSMKLEGEPGAARPQRPKEGRPQNRPDRDGRPRPPAVQGASNKPSPQKQPSIQDLKNKFGKPDRGSQPQKKMKLPVNIKKLLP